MREAILVISFLILVFISGLFPLEDLDVWWHIKTGQCMVETGQFPVAETFSYTARGEWVMDEWFGQIMLYLTYAFGGTGALIVMRACIILLLFGLLVYTSRKMRLGAAYGVIIGYLALLAAYERFLMKPALFGLLLFGLFFALLVCYRHNGTGAVYLLPLLYVVWVNVHPGHVAGLFLIAAFLIGEFIETAVRTRGLHVFSLRAACDRRLLFILAAMLIAGTINPYGPRMLLWPFEHMHRALIPLFAENIAEWRPPSFCADGISSQFLAFLALTVFVLAGFFLSPRHCAGDCIIVATLFIMSLSSRRHMDFFAVSCCFIAISHMSSAAGDGRFSVGRMMTILRKKGVQVVLSAVLLGHAGLVMVGRVPSYDHGLRAYGFGISDTLPSGAVSYIRSQGLQKQLFNEHALGGLCIFGLYPEYRVFIDGRNLLYLTGLFEEYIAVLNDPAGIERVAEKYGIRTVLIRHAAGVNDLLLGYLFKEGRWVCTYLDAWSCIFVRTPQSPQAVISQDDLMSLVKACGDGETGLRDINNPIRKSGMKRRCFFAYLNWAHLCEVLGQRENAEYCYRKALSLDGSSRVALSRLGYQYLHAGRYAEALECYGRLARLYPFDRRAANNIATIYIMQGRYDEALSRLHRARLFSPFNAGLLFNTALALQKKGEVGEAMRFCKKALFFDRTYPEAYNLLGQLYKMHGDYEKAVASFKQAIALKDDFSLAYNNLGSLYGGVKGDMRRAEELFLEAIAVGGEDEGALLARSNLERLRGL
ncbi:MAG: tetratricopeptide repeat protein [Candidatus Omnitrophica bacterium]|nr:tetratricopeptide repeat protein [Candidatus Omnitrophota bacterium]